MKNKTVIAIAHRLNSIAGFDRIILFKEGRIVGQGTFEELLHTDSYFMEIMRMLFSGGLVITVRCQSM